MHLSSTHWPRTFHCRAIVTIFIVTGTLIPIKSFGQLPSRYDIADLKAIEKTFSEIAEGVRPSVVAIRSYYLPNKKDSVHKDIRIPISQGTGFVIGGDGFIATNQHVLEDANAFSVILDNGLEYEATVLQSDIRSDLAVLKIEAADLTPVRYGDLAAVKVGQWTFAVGNPFGLANEQGKMSVKVGTVSQLGRDLTRRLNGNEDIRYYGNLIESSSAINPGNSGGPLFNIDGEIIGVIAAIETSSGVSEGVGFAIPIDKNTKHILASLKRGEKVRYGFLGVQIGPTRTTPSSPFVRPSKVFAGAEITGILVADGPADQAGLQTGDVVLELDGISIESADHLVRLVGFAPVGSELSVTYLRRNVKRKTIVTLADRHQFLPVSSRN